MKTTLEWIDEQVDVSKLDLDLRNPRIPHHVRDHEDDKLIRNYLLENEKVLSIAKSIANNGYHRSAVSIVYKENENIIVLDGNRRLAACQLLLNPVLAPKARDRSELEELGTVLNRRQLKNIKIAIAPSRKEADKEIIDIHVNVLLKPWQVLERLRKYKDLIEQGEYSIASASLEFGIKPTKFQKELEVLYFYDRILGQSITQNEEAELLKSGFNKITRIITSASGKRILNYSIDSKGNVSFQNDKEANDKINKFTPYIVNNISVPAQATQKWLAEKVYPKIDPILFPEKKENKNNAGTTTSTSTTVTTGSEVKPDWVTNDEYRLYDGADRVKDILRELTKNKPVKDNINILAVTLRVVIELAIYDYLKSKRYIAKMIKDKKLILESEGKELFKNWSPGLKEMLMFMLNDANKIITDPQDKKAINKIMSDRKEFINDLDYFMHNVSYSPTVTKLNEIWKTFGRLIFDVIAKLK